jgi:hypothetical protein
MRIFLARIPGILRRALTASLRIFRRSVRWALAIGVIAFLLFAVGTELGRRPVLVDSFEVPKSLQDRGYTGKSLATQLIDKLNDLARQTNTSLHMKKRPAFH